MTLPAITYGEVINLLIIHAKKCKNFRDDGSFEQLPELFKNGYASSWVKVDGDGRPETSTYYRTKLIANAVSETTYAALNDSINAFLTKTGLATKLNENVKESEFINLLNNIASFCASTIAYTTYYSRFGDEKQNTFKIFIPETNFLAIEPNATNFNYKLITASDANSVLNSVEEIIKQYSRSRNCIYTIEISTSQT